MDVVELFAGVGGFRVGLESASDTYKTIFANQFEPKSKLQHAFDCYNYHFGNSSLNSNEDIATAKLKIPNHDLLVGGFPCQDYSVAKVNAQGITGQKGVLWWDINDVLTTNRPKYVLLENVDRLLKSPSKQRGRDFGIILYCFNKLGYSVEWRVINAADYGFPQRRTRVFIFATLNNSLSSQYKNPKDVIFNGLFADAFPIKNYLKFDCTSPNTTLNKYLDVKEVSDSFKFNFEDAGFMVDGRIYTENPITDYKGKYTFLKDILEECVDSKYFVDYNDLERWKYLKGAKSAIRHYSNGLPYKYSEGAVPYPDILDAPARTMLTSEASINRCSHIIIDPTIGKERILTPIECERLNGFPDNWTNTGMPHKFRYFTMGNALVVGIVKQLGKSLLKIYEDKAYNTQAS